MVKSVKKVFIVMLAVFAVATVFTVVAYAGNTDTDWQGYCQRITASGNNRSGTCNNLRQGGGTRP